MKVDRYFLQRMKTNWGGCNHKAGHIRLNTQLVTKPRDLLEYVIVHEMVHLIEPTHSDRFLAILGKHYPTVQTSPLSGTLQSSTATANITFQPDLSLVEGFT